MGIRIKFMENKNVLKCFNIVAKILPGLATQTMIFIDEQVLLRDQQMRMEGFNAARKTEGCGMQFTYDYDDFEDYEQERKK